MISALLPARRVQCRALALALTVLAPLASGAHAQDRSAEVKKMVEEALAGMVPAGMTVLDVRWEGQVSVKPSGDRYAVSLPALRLSGPGGERAEVKGATLDMSPAGSDRWHVLYQLPSPIRVLAAGGKPIGQVVFERQRFAGLWVQGLKNFVEIDAELGSVAFVDAGGARPFALASLTSRRRYAEGKPGKWSGPDATRIENLVLEDAGGVSVRLDNVVFESSVTDFDMAAGARLAEQIQKASAEPVAPKKSKGKQTQKAAKKDAKAIRQALAGIPLPLAAASGSLRVDRLAAKTKEGGFALAQASYEAAVEGLDRERSTARLGYSHNGLAVVPPPSSPDFTPKLAEFRARVSNLPNAQLWQAILAFVADAAERDADAAANRLAEKLPEMLSDAGVEFGLDAFKLDMISAATDLSGVAVFEKNAAWGVVAGFNLVLTGLDVVIKALRAPDADADAAQMMLPVLTIVQALGQQGEPDQGRSVRRYRFEVSADGQTLLNGTDLSQLVAGFSGKEDKPAPAPKKQAPKNR